MQKSNQFFTSNSYTFSRWRPTDFEDLESLPLSLTSNLQSPRQVLKTTQPSTADHLRSVPKEQAPSCQDCQKAMGRACSSAQLRPRPTEGQKSFEHRFRCDLPPSSVMELLTHQPCLTGTLYCPVGCLQHQLMQRIAIQWNGYITLFLDPNKGPQM